MATDSVLVNNQQKDFFVNYILASITSTELLVGGCILAITVLCILLYKTKHATPITTSDEDTVPADKSASPRKVTSLRRKCRFMYRIFRRLVLWVLQLMRRELQRPHPRLRRALRYLFCVARRFPFRMWRWTKAPFTTKLYRESIFWTIIITGASILVFLLIKWAINAGAGHWLIETSKGTDEQVLKFFHSKGLAYIGWGVLGVFILLGLWRLVRRIARRYRARTPDTTVRRAGSPFLNTFTWTKLLWSLVAVTFIMMFAPMGVLIIVAVAEKYMTERDMKTDPTKLFHDKSVEVTKNWSEWIEVPYRKTINWDLMKENVWLETQINEGPAIFVIQAPINDNRFMPISLPKKLKKVRFRIVPPEARQVANDWNPNKVVVRYHFY